MVPQQQLRGHFGRINAAQSQYTHFVDFAAQWRWLSKMDP
jgi:hypothetical protein